MVFMSWGKIFNIKRNFLWAPREVQDRAFRTVS